jgi:penicillin-binding protein 2
MFDPDFGSNVRAFVVRMVIVAAFLLIVFKLWDLQLANKISYGKKSEQITTRVIIRQPLRGQIYDRNGNVMVENDPSYTISIIPHEFKRSQVAELAQLLQMDTLDIERRIKTGMEISPFFPVKLKRDIPFSALTTIEENLRQFSGVYFDIEPKRVYVGKARASHILGFTKEISENQLATMGDYYKPGDIVGYSGLEASYETILRGEKGYQFLAVNARGQVVGDFNNGKDDIASEDGSDLYLTIDEGLQAMAESLLVGRRGAVVALDPDNGAVLAMASAPDYDPSIFSGYTSREDWDRLNNDPDHPLFNRATLATLPPGSTFKMVLASAALQNDIVNDDWTIHCTGSFFYGGRIFKCHGAHGTVNIIEAIEKSCNVFFYNLMLKVGFDDWTKFGSLFGFGQKTGIDLKEENPGVLPSPEYFDRVYGKNKWTNGYLISLAIGQGEVSATPLQMAAYTMAISNYGKYFQPHLVNYIRDHRTGRIYYTRYSERQIPISKEVFDQLRQAMYLVVNGPGGTGHAAQIPGIEVAGKTGTAQNPRGKDHAWFIAFAPYDHPRIAICVMIENAGFGGAVAAPIAAKLIKYYLSEPAMSPQQNELNGAVAANAEIAN